MREMSLRRHLLTCLLAALLLSACGYNPKSAGDGVDPDLGFTGTVECLYAGCHDSFTTAAGSYQGFNPVLSWPVASHGNGDATPSALQAVAEECAGCHDPAGDLEQDAAYIFTSSSPALGASVLAALGLTPRPMTGCEGCHGSGSSHYAYAGTTPYLGDHRAVLASTLSPVYPDLYHGLSCGPCHSPDVHAGGSEAENRLANQYQEWWGGDGPGLLSEDGHSDSLIVETNRGDMNGSLRGVYCASCHTVEGFVRYAAHREAVAQSAVDRMVAYTGDTDIEDPSYAPGDEALPQVNCVSCHPSHEEDRIRSPFTAAGLCMECHNVIGLRAADGSGVTDLSLLEIPRHPQRELFLGVKSSVTDSLRGYEFPGFTYADSSHAGTDNIPGGCIGCHCRVESGAGLEEYPYKATTGHSFRPRLEGCWDAGSTCHSPSHFAYQNTTIAAFDFSSALYSGVSADHDGDGEVEPLQQEVAGMLKVLRELINDQPEDRWLSSQGLFDLPSMAAASATVRAAAYNYNLVVEDGSLGMHNPLYTRSLLSASSSVLSP